MNPLHVPFLFFATVSTMAFFSCAGDADIRQPEQPASGPGGAEYSHKSVRGKFIGEGAQKIWIYEPDEPRPEKAPVILFMHGWSAMDPGPYLAWIKHLARRGNLVLYPRYQLNIATMPEVFTPNSIASIKAALLHQKQSKESVQPDEARVASVGHSYGGVLAANLAALAKETELPAVKAVYCAEPGTNGFGKTYADYSQIPAGTLLLCMAGEDDILVKDRDAKRILKEAVNVAAADKNFILLHTDKRGQPPQHANHFSPVAPEGHVDAHDFYGHWKWFDALCDAAFHDKNREYALGNTPQQRFLGKWSDGTPLKEPAISHDP